MCYVKMLCVEMSLIYTTLLPQRTPDTPPSLETTTVNSSPSEQTHRAPRRARKHLHSLLFIESDRWVNRWVDRGTDRHTHNPTREPSLCDSDDEKENSPVCLRLFSDPNQKTKNRPRPGVSRAWFALTASSTGGGA